MLQTIDLELEVLAVAKFVSLCRQLENSISYKNPNPLVDIAKRYFPDVCIKTIQLKCQETNSCVKEVPPRNMKRSYEQLVKQAKAACREDAVPKREDMLFVGNIGQVIGNPFGSQPVEAQQPVVVPQVNYPTAPTDPVNNWPGPSQDVNPTPLKTRDMKEVDPVSTLNKRETPNYSSAVVIGEEAPSRLAPPGNPPRVHEQPPPKPTSRTTNEKLEELRSSLHLNMSSQPKHNSKPSAEKQASQIAPTMIGEGNQPKLLRPEPTVLPVNQTNSSHQVQQNQPSFFTTANTQQPSSNPPRRLPVQELHLPQQRKSTKSIGKPSVPPNNKPGN